MKEIEYHGDFETFFKLCQTLEDGGLGMAYNFNSQKGIAITKVDGASRIWITKDDIQLEKEKQPLS